MNLFQRAATAALFCASCAWSQGLLGFGLSGGVKGGFPLTDPIDNVTFAGVNVPSVNSYSNSTDFVVGPMLELHLPLGLSVEGDGLYRLVNVSARSSETLGSFLTSADYGFWEVSVLGKYHLPTPIVKPYIAAGPSFRTVSGLSDYFSTKGITGAIGVELKLLKLRVGPEIRYTHWGSEPASGIAAADNSIRSSSNQVELLFGLSF